MSKDKTRAERRKHQHDKHMYNTEIEVKCQNTPETFRIESNKPHTKKSCWCCGKETFEMFLEPGLGAVKVLYTDAIGCQRWLSPIHVDVQVGVAGYTATDGEFILVKQELP